MSIQKLHITFPISIKVFFCHLIDVARGKLTTVGLRVMNMQVCWLENDLAAHMLALNQ